MSRSVRSILSDSISGPTGEMLEWADVSRHLKGTVFYETEIKHREDAQRRQEFFKGHGDRYISALIDTVFKDPEVRDKRNEWVPLGKPNNVWKRIVQEKATVYNVPPVRELGSESDQANFDEIARQCRLNSMAKRWNQWGELQRTLAVGFRVRKRSTGEIDPQTGEAITTDTPIVDVVSRDSFFALGHPFDATEVIAIGIRVSTALPKENTPETDAADEVWEVWTEHERFYCDGNGVFNRDIDVWEHEWDRMPWMLYSPEPPAGTLIDHWTGSETDAAHMAVWFEKICELKESKSATKIPVVSGDTTRDARDQAQDSEIVVEMKDGASLTAVDMSMDLSMFRDSGDHTFISTAANHGIAPGILKHQGVQSAQARELMRAPLKELRREQEDYLREFERQFIEIIAMVVKRDLTEFAFSTQGWSIDFQERATALDPKREDEVFEGRRKLGLTSTIREIMKRNPDFSREQAQEFLVSNIQDEFARNVLMRPLQQISGSMDAEQPDNAQADQVPPTETGEQGAADLRALDGGVNDNLEDTAAQPPPVTRRSGRRRRR